jgi:hypothetical protein
LSLVPIFKSAPDEGIAGHRHAAATANTDMAFFTLNSPRFFYVEIKSTAMHGQTRDGPLAGRVVNFTCKLLLQRRCAPGPHSWRAVIADM